MPHLLQISIFFVAFLNFSFVSNSSEKNLFYFEDYTTRELANRITANCKTDSEKAKAIFNWVATHISYDYKLYNSKTLQSQFYTSEEKLITETLRRKKAVCSGYAYLFKNLCDNLGIECVVINGYTKKMNLKKKPTKPNHSWNAVKINNEWILMDITWASNNKINGKPNKFWYATPPKEFILSHYPQDPKWSLLGSTIPNQGFFGK